MLTVALVNQDRENNMEKRSQGLKSEKEALLIGKDVMFSSSAVLNNIKGIHLQVVNNADCSALWPEVRLTLSRLYYTYISN